MEKVSVSKDLNITILQTQLHWEDIQANLEMVDAKLEGLKGKQDVIVLPEMFSTGFSMKVSEFAEDMNGSAMQWMTRKSKELDCILTGSLMLTDQGKYYNRMIWMRPDGTFDTYDKRHLFRLAHEEEHYEEGRSKTIVELNGWKICLQVCYDLRFPVWSRNQNLEYDCILYVANWPERRNLAWKSLLMARAIENQSYVVGVNRVGNDGNDVSHSGDSAVIDPLGEYLYHAPPHKEQMNTITLSKEFLVRTRESLPFHKDADSFELKV